MELSGLGWSNFLISKLEESMTATQREAINAVRSWARMKNHNPVEGSLREF